MKLSFIYFGPELPSVVLDADEGSHVEVDLFPSRMHFAACLFFYASLHPGPAYLVERWLLEHNCGQLPKGPGYIREDTLGITFAYPGELPSGFGNSESEFTLHFQELFEALESFHEVAVPLNVVTTRYDHLEQEVWRAFLEAARPYLPSTDG
jgi:hypothetical protein